MRPILVCDLDGTLVDTVPDLAAILNQVMGARGLAPFGLAETAAMVGDGVAALLDRAFAARGRDPDPAAVGEYIAAYGARPDAESRLYPGVAEGLAALGAAGWRFAVCTNKPEAPARALLAALGIGGRFAAVGGGDSFPTRKPDPGHLRATLAAAGAATAEAVMLGDHPNDLAAARGAGVPAIFAAWGYGRVAEAPVGGVTVGGVTVGGVAVARRFAEVPALAAGLLGVGLHRSGPRP